jgi:glutathione S-transferase
MKLVTAEHCPFCKRCILALTEKAIAFETFQVDLTEKADVLEVLSPYGRVPVLFDGGKPIYESSVINEYLEDTRPEPRLLPADPQRRAQARFWIDFCDTRFMPSFFNLLKAPAGERRAAFRTKLMDHLAFMNQEGQAHPDAGEAYWMGRDFTLVDIAFYPFFERFAAVEAYRGVEIPAEFTRLNSWLGLLGRRPSVRSHCRPRAFYVSYFREFYAD